MVGFLQWDSPDTPDPDFRVCDLATEIICALSLQALAPSHRDRLATNCMANILNFMEQTVAALEREGGGEISLAYITAEFAPFSSSKKPDIVMVHKDVNGSRAYLIEYSVATVPSDLTYFRDLLREHKEFVISSSEVPCEYAFATCQNVPLEVQTQFWESDRIKVIPEVSAPDILAKLVNAWSNSYQLVEAQS